MTPEKPPGPSKVLSALEPERWRLTLEKEGVTPAAEITDRTRDGIARVLCQLGDGLTALNSPVRRGLEELLLALAGKSFGSLEANQVVARGVQELLNRLGLRVACPKEGCGRPAVLRCAAAGNSKQGVFHFDHSSGGKRTTHMGSSAFPCLTLVNTPPDRRRSARSS
jgi:hypothetical protein